MSLTTGLRFRVWVGELDADELTMIDEAWIGRPGDTTPPEIVATWQGTICRAAAHDGKRWRLEVYDPADDETLWFGSDSAGMVMPVHIQVMEAPSPN